MLARIPAGLVLLARQTVAAAAQLDITAGITARFTKYLLELENIIPGTNDNSLLMRYSADGGAAFDATAIYANSYAIQAGTIRETDVGTSVELCWRVSSTANGGGLSGYVYLSGLAGALYKHHQFLISGNGWTGAADTVLVARGGGQYRSVTAVNAIRLLMNGGTINGTARLYGVRKA